LNSKDEKACCSKNNRPKVTNEGVQDEQKGAPVAKLDHLRQKIRNFFSTFLFHRKLPSKNEMPRLLTVVFNNPKPIIG